MRSTLAVALLATVAACDSDTTKTDAPRYDALAAAKADGPVLAGALGYREPVLGNLAKTAPRQTWTLEARPGAVIDLEVTHAGTTAALDTVLTVVGPVQTTSATSPVVAEDDDSGWGLHSRIRGLTLGKASEHGALTYLVTVQSYDGKQAGKYRLVATCKSGTCEPEPQGVAVDEGYCHPLMAAGIRTCIDEQLADIDRDPSTWTALDVGRSCVDAEPVARWRDAICADERPAPSWCGLDYELFMNAQVSLCEDGAIDYALAKECVFGAGYRDLRGGTARGITVTARRVVTLQTTLTPLESEQLVAAVKVAYEDAHDVASALDAVDGGEVNQLHVWDATHAQGFVAYEYGAGDNSYGGIVAEGAASIVAAIHDGDYASCPLPGPALAVCARDADCEAGLRCTGVSAGFGRCVASTSHPDDGASCHASAASNGCADNSGLVCAGLDRDGDGMCMQAWMRGGFDDYAVAHIAPHGTLTRALNAYGLTTVSTDVSVRLLADFGAPADLRITLTNPATTEGVVWDREAGELDFARAVYAFPGDESANGTWTLTIENLGSTSGTLVSWGLDIMSRWD